MTGSNKRRPPFGRGKDTEIQDRVRSTLKKQERRLDHALHQSYRDGVSAGLFGPYGTLMPRSYDRHLRRRKDGRLPAELPRNYDYKLREAIFRKRSQSGAAASAGYIQADGGGKNSSCEFHPKNSNNPLRTQDLTFTQDGQRTNQAASLHRERSGSKAFFESDAKGAHQSLSNKSGYQTTGFQSDKWVESEDSLEEGELNDSPDVEAMAEFFARIESPDVTSLPATPSEGSPLRDKKGPGREAPLLDAAPTGDVLHSTKPRKYRDREHPASHDGGRPTSVHTPVPALASKVNSADVKRPAPPAHKRPAGSLGATDSVKDKAERGHVSTAVAQKSSKSSLPGREQKKANLVVSDAVRAGNPKTAADRVKEDSRQGLVLAKEHRQPDVPPAATARASDALKKPVLLGGSQRPDSSRGFSVSGSTSRDRERDRVLSKAKSTHMIELPPEPAVESQRAPSQKQKKKIQPQAGIQEPSSNAPAPVPAPVSAPVPASTSAVAAGTAPMASDDWVQCDVCSMWRITPPGMEFEDTWACRENTWIPSELARCYIPEVDTTRAFYHAMGLPFVEPAGAAAAATATAETAATAHAAANNSASQAGPSNGTEVPVKVWAGAQGERGSKGVKGPAMGKHLSSAVPANKGNENKGQRLEVGDAPHPAAREDDRHRAGRRDQKLQHPAAKPSDPAVTVKKLTLVSREKGTETAATTAPVPAPAAADSWKQQAGKSVRRAPAPPPVASDSSPSSPSTSSLTPSDGEPAEYLPPRRGSTGKASSTAVDPSSSQRDKRAMPDREAGSEKRVRRTSAEAKPVLKDLETSAQAKEKAPRTAAVPSDKAGSRSKAEPAAHREEGHPRDSRARGDMEGAVSAKRVRERDGDAPAVGGRDVSKKSRVQQPRPEPGVRPAPPAAAADRLHSAPRAGEGAAEGEEAARAKYEAARALKNEASECTDAAKKSRLLMRSALMFLDCQLRSPGCIEHIHRAATAFEAVGNNCAMAICNQLMAVLTLEENRWNKGGFRERANQLKLLPSSAHLPPASDPAAAPSLPHAAALIQTAVNEGAVPLQAKYYSLRAHKYLRMAEAAGAGSQQALDCIRLIGCFMGSEPLPTTVKRVRTALAAVGLADAA